MCTITICNLIALWLTVHICGMYSGTSLTAPSGVTTGTTNMACGECVRCSEKGFILCTSFPPNRGWIAEQWEMSYSNSYLVPRGKYSYLYACISFLKGLVKMLLRLRAAAMTRHSSRQSNTCPSSNSRPRRGLIGRDSNTSPTNVRSPSYSLTTPPHVTVMAPS